VLAHAYKSCRANHGAAGIDSIDFEVIEFNGLERWLANLRQELWDKQYIPDPLLRVWIPKSSGGQRPLGIATIRDRVVQMAVLLVIGPIFEADLLPNQYGFRGGLDAKMAVRRVFWHVKDYGRNEVVDADLSDYFITIPHKPLMKCLARRICDRQVLHIVKQWLDAAVIERQRHGMKRTTEARDSGRGTPQGAVVSPLLSNLYFRRFALAWQQRGIDQKLQAHIVNYADDFVICCKPGNGAKAMEVMRSMMSALGLTVNERKTKLVQLPEGQFDFLGYTFGTRYSQSARATISTRPSKKAVSKLIGRIHDETTRRYNQMEPEEKVEEINRIVRGWCNYFNQGPVFKEYWYIRRYTEKRVRRWLMRRQKRQGTGYRQYSTDYLYGTLGLYKPWVSSSNRSSAKA
jgi:group II intron reverse transcriptase/maturase